MKQAPSAASIAALFLTFIAVPDRAVAAAPEEVAALQAYYTGNGLLNRGLFDLAAKEYRTFLAALPDHDKAPQARYGLGVCLFRSNKLDDAARELEPLAELREFEFAAEVATMLGQARLAAGRHQEALDFFQRVLDRHAEHALADSAAAQYIEAAFRAGKRREARKTHRRFVDTWPRSSHRDRADYFAGLSALAEQEIADAANLFENVLKSAPASPFADHACLLAAQTRHQLNDLSRSETHYKTALENEKSPYRAEALYGLAAVYKASERDSDAAPLLDEYLEKHAADARVDLARLLRGRIYFDAGEYGDAAPLFKAAAKTDDEVGIEAAYWSAKCDLRRERYAPAAEALSGAIEKAGDHRLLPEMRYDRAIALYRGGQRDPAADALAEFLDRHGEHALAPEAALLRASTLHQLGRFEDGLKAVRLFLDRWPAHAEAAAVRLLLVEDLYFLKQYEEVIKAASDLLTDAADHPDAQIIRFRLGMAQYFLQQFDAAEKTLAAISAKAADDVRYASLPLALGDIHFQKGAWAAAVDRLSQYLRKGEDQPGADDAILKLGLSFQRQGKHREALSQYDRLLAKFEKSAHRVQAHFERGQVLIALDDLDQAAKAFDAVLASEEDSRFATPSRRHLSYIAYRKGDFREAARRFGRLARELRGREGEADAVYQQALAMVNAADNEEAQRVLERFLKKFDKDERVETARAYLAIVQSRQDRHADALKTMEEVNADRLAADLRASLNYERGWCLRRTGKADEAAGVFRALLKSDPPQRLRAHALLELADLESTAKRMPEAIAALESLRQLLDGAKDALPPELDEQASYRLGVALFQTGRMADAEKMLGRLLRDHEKSDLARSAAMFRGEALVSLSRHQDAVPCFERVIAGPADDPSRAIAMLRLGDAFATLQEWSRSTEAFARYLKDHADGAQWYQAEFGLGWATENQGQLDAAIEHYRRVVTRHQGQTAARAQFQIGQCLFAKKAYEAAAAELLKVDILYAYPEWSAAALFEAGRCFEALARRAEARQQFEAVVARFAGSRWADMSAERLRQAADTGLPGR